MPPSLSNTGEDNSHQNRIKNRHNVVFSRLQSFAVEVSVIGARWVNFACRLMRWLKAFLGYLQKVLRNQSAGKNLLSRMLNKKYTRFEWNLYVFIAKIACSAIVDVRRSRFQKFMWIVLVLFGLGLSIYQIQDRLSYYFQYPTSASLDVQHNDQLRFPQVTICNENQIFRSAAEKFGTSLCHH